MGYGSKTVDRLVGVVVVVVIQRLLAHRNHRVCHDELQDPSEEIEDRVKEDLNRCI